MKNCKFNESVLVETKTESGEKKDGSNQSVHMKKELGLLEGVAIIVGIIIGSGMGSSINDVKEVIDSF